MSTTRTHTHAHTHTPTNYLPYSLPKPKQSKVRRKEVILIDLLAHGGLEIMSTTIELSTKWNSQATTRLSD